MLGMIDQYKLVGNSMDGRRVEWNVMEKNSSRSNKVGKGPGLVRKGR